MDFAGIVPVSLEVVPYYRFEPLSFDVRPGKRARVEEHFANVPEQGEGYDRGETRNDVSTKV